MTVDVQATRDVIEIMTGGWRAQALYTAVKLGIADQIEAGRRTPSALAESTGGSEEGIHRLMRLLVSMDVFEGNASEGFSNTATSRVLLDGTDSLQDLCTLYGEEFYSAWGHAHHAVATASSGFEAAYGTSLYAHLSDNPVMARRFQRTMNAGSMFFHRVPSAFDFRGKHVVDVGGGGGQLLATVLKATPDARGTLFDREHMIPKATEHLEREVGLDRVDLAAGDMFRTLPSGADVYMYCRVLAGWDDEAVVETFRHCHEAMPGPSARLLVLDRFVQDEGSTVLPALWDLHLLMTTGGEHRTLERITKLLNRAGFAVEATKELPMETTAVVAKPCPVSQATV